MVKYVAAQPLPVPSVQVSTTLCEPPYVPAPGVAVVMGAAVSISYDSVCTASALPALSTEKNFSVVLAVMERGAV